MSEIQSTVGYMKLLTALLISLTTERYTCRLEEGILELCPRAGVSVFHKLESRSSRINSYVTVSRPTWR